MDEHFNGAPLLPQNTVDIDTIQSQRFYCEKYDASGHWIIKDGKVATVFSYRDQQFILPYFSPFKTSIIVLFIPFSELFKVLCQLITRRSKLVAPLAG